MMAERLRDVVPPYSIEAEMSALGSMLLSPKAAEELAGVLCEEDFYHPSHKEIFRSMRNLLGSCKPIDEITLPQELTGRGVYEKVGGWDCISGIAEKVPSAANATYYAGIVLDMAALRKLEDAGRQIVSGIHANDGTSAEEKIEKAERMIFELGRKRLGKELVSVRALAKDFFTEVDQVIESGKPGVGLGSGFSDLDRVTTGFYPGDLVIVGARPSIGKSSMAAQFARYAAEASGKNVAFFSLEMSDIQITRRLVQIESQIGTGTMKSPSISMDQYKRLSDGCERLYSLPLWIDDSSDISPVEMRGKCRRLQAEGGLSLVVVDYLQLMRASRKTENRVQEISDIARALKAMAKELKVPVVALSQLNRSVESREDKRPTLSDLRESGSIEAEADLVMLLYRDAYYKQKKEVPEAIDWSEVQEAEVIIAKHRNGPTGKVILGFQPSYAKFTQLFRGAA